MRNPQLEKQILIDKIMKDIEIEKMARGKQTINPEFVQNIKLIIENEIIDFDLRFCKIEIVKKGDYTKCNQISIENWRKIENCRNDNFLILYIYTDGTKEYIINIEILHIDDGNIPHLSEFEENLYKIIEEVRK